MRIYWDRIQVDDKTFFVGEAVVVLYHLLQWGYTTPVVGIRADGEEVHLQFVPPPPRDERPPSPTTNTLSNFDVEVIDVRMARLSGRGVGVLAAFVALLILGIASVVITVAP